MGDNRFINRFCERGIRFIIKEDILRNRIVLFYFETPFIISVYFISTQNTWYWLDIDSNYCRPNFYWYWPTLMSKSTRMNWASSARLTESLEISVFIWNDLVLVTKSFKEYTPNQLWQIFRFFLTQFIIGQTSTSTGRPLLIWAGPPLQGWPKP